MKIYIGIDNGVSGSIGVLKDDTYLFIKTPTISELDYTKEKKNITRVNFDGLSSLLKFYSDNPSEVLVCLERPMVNPGRWIATSSALRCHEATLIAIQSSGLPYIFIDSKEWQRQFFSKDICKENLKSESLRVGNDLFPNYQDYRHPDRDGLLIAEYCKRKNL